MMPENERSIQPIRGNFLTPPRINPLIDHEWGGVDLNDTSKDLMNKLWRCFYQDGWIKIESGTIKHSVLQIENVISLSLAFDFNMRVTLSYTTLDLTGGGSGVKTTSLYWYDSSAQAMVTTNYGATVRNPQVSLDDHRLKQSSNADIIFAYVRNSSIYYRMQRDRYLIEYLFYPNLAAKTELIQIGMNTNNRFQFAFK